MSYPRITWIDHDDHRVDNSSQDTQVIPRVLCPWQIAMQNLFHKKAFVDTEVRLASGAAVSCHRIILSRTLSDMSAWNEDGLEMLYSHEELDGPSVSLHGHLLSCLTEGTFADVVIRAGPETIQAHRCILAAHSAYFLAIFSSSFRESELQTVDLEDTDMDSLRCVLWYMYGAANYKEALTEDNAVSVLTLAQKLIIPPLVDELVDQLGECVTPSNVCSFLALARNLGLHHLYEICVCMCARNLSELQASPYFSDLDPKVQESLHILQNSFERVPTAVGTVITARELLALLKESLDESQERFDESFVIHNRQTLENEEAISRLQANPIALSKLMERRERYAKVATSLIYQQRKLERQWQFYRDQKAAFDQIGLWEIQPSVSAGR